MQAIKIRENIYWVGAIDWDLRNFHGYLTQRGSTYNSYLVLDDKITLIDNVKDYLAEEQISRIKSVIDPSKIDYIIQNHIEMDHSGSLPLLKQLSRDAKIFISPKGAEGIPKHFNMKEEEFNVVKSGDVLNLGNRTLQFILTPMVHWPDNMVTYCTEEHLLFSNDAFGQHLASSERFDDEFSADITMEEAKKYYANIVMPYGRQVQKALLALQNLEVDTIAPSHGLIWRKDTSKIIQKYKKWSENKVDDKALIIYDTMWQSTKTIAYAIQDAFNEKNYTTRMLSLQYNHISDIMTELLNAKYICIGSPTLNSNVLPSVSAFLTYMKGLSPQSRIGLAFGSYGWGGQSIDIIDNTLKNCGFETMDPIKIQYRPDKETLEEITTRVKNNL
ncbi:MAG: FprA family A-type flavoprotein [Candidatus Cloacimonadia bacterium]